ncbi:MAG: hypothetical protein WBI74_05750 [Caldicoprobacterales bacterium]
MLIYVSSTVSEYKNELAELVRAFFPGVTVKTADNIEKVSILSENVT